VHLLSDDEFDEMALRVFAFQYRENRTYGAYCARHGATPETVATWADVPPVPATAFKRLDLFAGDPGAAEAVFRTSGTTRGGEARGRHLVRSLSLYRAALLPPFRRHLLPDGARLPLLSLVPSPEALPDSSLAYMVGTVARELSAGATWLVGRDGSVDTGRFVAECSELNARDQPALLVGTALAFARLVEALDATGGAGVDLPAGSRVMETGGFKARAGELRRTDLYASLSRLLGVPDARIVNEYGMTELLSQLYEPVLGEGPSARGRHVAPPWLRVRALDPVTLSPRQQGEVGLLSFFDLANVGSVCHVLTEDVGSVSADGVRLSGRVEGAEPRGCSLALEQLASVAGVDR
jgi:hypothetical protein